MPSRSILLIDDDVELCELLSDYLRTEGFQIESAHASQEGLEKALSGKHGLVVLDVMLPGMNGFDVLRQLRARSQIPVIMLTARGDDIDRIVGLELGADDYLPKPFNPRELVARIRAIQRRTREKAVDEELAAKPEALEISGLRLDPRTRIVSLSEYPVELTAAEFTLLEVLMRASGQVMSRDDLVRRALGRSLSPYDRSLDVHVSNLRKKLGVYPDGSERIKTIRGVGYMFVPASECVKSS